VTGTSYKYSAVNREDIGGRRVSKKRKNPVSRHNDKVETVMHEFKEGELHSGSKSGPRVTNRKQAIAIALSEQRKKNRRG